jgi:thiosulfate reductase cytochrome b subunit
MHATLTDNLPTTESPPVKESGVPVIRKHHFLVRLSHWLNVPILLGLILSGMSIYWASPVYQQLPDPQTGNVDVVADIGVWICAHVPGLHHYSRPPDWVYSHMSLGTYMLAPALRLHWFFAYLFMLNGLVYITGLVMGGGWRALLPRSTDLRNALRMMRHYIGAPFAVVLRRT